MASEETLQQFVSITGATAKEAKHFIEASDNNLETAVNLYFQQVLLIFIS